MPLRPGAKDRGTLRLAAIAPIQLNTLTDAAAKSRLQQQTPMAADEPKAIANEAKVRQDQSWSLSLSIILTLTHEKAATLHSLCWPWRERRALQKLWIKMHCHQKALYGATNTIS